LRSACEARVAVRGSKRDYVPTFFARNLTSA
jgi:hypothetical protein